MTDENQKTDDQAKDKGTDELVEIVEGTPDGDERLSVQAQAAQAGAAEETDDAQLTDEERERRAAERRAKKERRKRAIDRDKKEMNFLRGMNDRLEKRLLAVEAETVENRIVSVQGRASKLREQIKLADDLKKRALDADNSDDVVFADNTKADLQAELARVEAAEQQLRGVHQERVQAARAPTPKPQQQEVEPEVVNFARRFYANNRWCDPTGRSGDSRVVFELDNALTDEGYDPTTQEYWDELQSRVEARLPQHFQQKAAEQDDDDDEDEPPPRRQEPAQKPNGAAPQQPARKASGPKLPNGAPAGQGQKFYISAERKQALVDLGVWEDRVLRDRYIKKYMEYDRERANQANR